MAFLVQGVPERDEKFATLTAGTKHSRVLADNFLARVASNARECIVHIDDDAVGTRDENGFTGVRKDAGCQLQFFLGMLAFGNVVDDREQHGVIVRVDGRNMGFDIAKFARGQSVHEVEGIAFVVKCSESLLGDLFRVQHVDRADVQLQHLCLGIPVITACRFIGVDDFAGERIGQHHDRRIFLEEIAEAFLVLSQRVLGLFAFADIAQLGDPERLATEMDVLADSAEVVP